MDLLPYKALHDFRDIIDILDQTSRQIYAQKKQTLLKGDEALTTKIGEGKDVMSILSKIPTKWLPVLYVAHCQNTISSASQHDRVRRGKFVGK